MPYLAMMVSAWSWSGDPSSKVRETTTAGWATVSATATPTPAASGDTVPNNTTATNAQTRRHTHWTKKRFVTILTMSGPLLKGEPLRYVAKPIARVEDDRGSLQPGKVHALVHGVNQYEICLVILGVSDTLQQLPVGQPQHLGQRVVEVHDRPERPESANDLPGGGLPHVLHVRLIRNTDDQDASTLNATPGHREHLADRSEERRRTARDRLHGLHDDRGGQTRAAQLPQQVMRVARDAMPSDTGPWHERHEPIRLRRSRLDDLYNVKVQHMADLGQLVGQGDVHRTEDVLEQLGHLGCVRGRDRMQVDLTGTEDGDREPEALRGCTADNTGNVLVGMCIVCRVDPLGTERDVDVPTDGEATPGQRGHQHLPGAPYVGRGREDDDLSSHRVSHDRGARTAQDGQVGHQVVVHRRGHRNNNGPGPCP